LLHVNPTTTPSPSPPPSSSSSDPIPENKVEIEIDETNSYYNSKTQYGHMGTIPLSEKLKVCLSESLKGSNIGKYFVIQLQKEKKKIFI